jgi:hypothetical protein
MPGPIDSCVYEFIKNQLSLHPLESACLDPGKHLLDPEKVCLDPWETTAFCAATWAQDEQ